MALFPKTPGVYIQEISTLPASIAAVPTAVPVFIGYTEKGTKATVMDPVRISSMIEYQQNFGGAYNEPYAVTLTDSGNTTSAPAGKFNLFTNLQMFYANGGGNCYIISVGNYFDSITKASLISGIAKAETADEPTLVVIPEAVTLNTTPADYRDVNDAAIAHCAKMQDRFAILDVPHVGTNTVFNDANGFRNNNVGANNLKYAAAYYPPLDTTLVRPYSDADTHIIDSRSTPIYTGGYANLFSVKNGYAAYGNVTLSSVQNGDTITINGVILKAGTDFSIAGTDAEDAESLKNAINENSSLNTIIAASTAGLTGGTLILLARNSVIDGTLFTYSSSNATRIPVPGTTPINFSTATGGNINTGLYTTLSDNLNANTLVLHPGSTMAGIYSAVDNDRGVWKAPANVSVSLVSSAAIVITDDSQADLNVDATSGKSINAIRDFTGRGTLVWGARTLDGNSNEWRYVPVRRLFIFVEESCKKASEFVVFEPNDKNTWIRVKSMISNFLTDIWKQGALAGDKPEQAYFVLCGLGETMSAQDILEGKLIVTIGLAAVRPAEFIILNFEHKLQEA